MIRIINVVERLNETIEEITPFAVWEEQETDVVIRAAKKYFRDAILEKYPHTLKEDIESFYKKGFSDPQGYRIDLVWSYVI